MKLYTPVNFTDLELLQEKVLVELSNCNSRNKLSTLFYAPDNTDRFYNIPELQRNLEMNHVMRSDIDSIAIHIIQPNHSVPIHTDIGNYIYSLNIPIQHCVGTEMIYYKTDSDPIVVRTISNDSTYNRYISVNCVPFDRVSLTQPYIVDVSVPHNVINPTPNIRIALLVRLNRFWQGYRDLNPN